MPLIKRCKARSLDGEFSVGAGELDSLNCLSRSVNTGVAYVEQMVSREHDTEATKRQRTVTEASAEGSASTDLCTCRLISSTSRAPPCSRSP